MADLKPALTPDEVKKAGVANIRSAYNRLAVDYNKILDGDIYYCHACNKFHNPLSFYSDKRYASGLYPQCKKSLLEEATDYDKKTKIYTDNREKTIKVFQKLDIPFFDSLYESALSDIQSEAGEKKRNTAYSHMLTMVKSLTQYRGLTFANSEFNEEYENPTSRRTPRKEIRKIFGSGFSDEDYLYLQDQYDDWKARTQVDSKSQETYIVRICFKLLDIWKAQRAGKDTKALDSTLNELMNAANLQPKQNTANAATDSLTFGQLIEKWENEKPIPEPSPEFKDVDGIGKYLRIFFAGHLCKALGLKNAYASEYEEYISKYKVSKPESQEEGSSDEIYETLFGHDGD